MAPSQHPHDLFSNAMREALIPPHKPARLRKLFPAFWADVAPPSVDQFHTLSSDARVYDTPHSVVVDPVSSFPAPWTFLRATL
jgi:hypothetical protein